MSRVAEQAFELTMDMKRDELAIENLYQQVECLEGHAMTACSQDPPPDYDYIREVVCKVGG